MDVWRTTTAILIAGLILLTSCGSGQLRPDTVIPATEAGYPSAEFYACGKHWVGLGFCVLEEGADLNAVALSVQGYYQGTIRWSTTCQSDTPLPDSVRYTNSQAVPYYVTGKAQQSCGISFVVSPEYPNEQNQSIVIHSFEAHLYVKVVKPGQAWQGFATKVAAIGGNPDVIKVAVPPDQAQAEILFKSDLCAINYDQTLPVHDGQVTVMLKDLMTVVPNRTCVVEGAAIMGDQAIRLSWMVSGYDTRFIPLPMPVVTSDSGKLSVQGDDNISVVALDGNWQITNATSFKMDESKPHVLRLLTVNGRSIVADFVPGRGWTWIF